MDDYPTSDAVKERDYLSRLMPFTCRRRCAGSLRETLLAGSGGGCGGKGVRLSDSDERDTQRIPEGGTPGYGVLTLRGGVALFDGLN